MKKGRVGLSGRHALLVIELMKDTTVPLGASHIKDRLWDRWGRNTPTSREIGSFLHHHENFHRVSTRPAPRTGAEYVWRE